MGSVFPFANGRGDSIVHLHTTPTIIHPDLSRLTYFAESLKIIAGHFSTDLFDPAPRYHSLHSPSLNLYGF
jgi:hypothetical protein